MYYFRDVLIHKMHVKVESMIGSFTKLSRLECVMCLLFNFICHFHLMFFIFKWNSVYEIMWHDG